MRCLAALLLLTPLTQAQTTWYVDVAGTPPGTGTVLDPYTSIQYAIDQPGTAWPDTISVAAGTYIENVVLTKGLSVIGVAGPEACVIQAAAPGPVVDISFAIVFSGFTVTGGMGSAGDGLHDQGGFDGLIKRCIIVGNAGRGLHFESSDGGGRVHNLTVVENGQEGLYMKPGSGVLMWDTIIWDNGLAPTVSFAPHGIGYFRYCVIENFPLQNKCFNFQVCGVTGWDPLLEDLSSGDYHLRLGSPCVDAGDPIAPLDPDGSRSDMGALVFDPQASPGPSIYCSSTVNSLGCTPAIAFTGAPRAGGAPFEISCASLVSNKLGLLFYGFQSKALPYQGTTLCVTAPVRRTSVQHSGGNPPPADGSGQYTFDFDAHLQSGVDPSLAAGALVYAQYWFRDPALGPLNTTGRSDALAFLIQP